LKKVLIVDWLDIHGGAERVIGSIERLISFNEVHTIINIMKKEDLIKIFKHKIVIHESGLKIFKNKFRYFFFTFHYFINKVKINKDAKLIISSSHSIAKGVRKSNQAQLHISYFQARNFNYIWEDVDLFFGKFKYLFYPLIYILRKIDVNQSQNPDVIIANSFFVKEWVKKRYNRESMVIYPPVDLSKFHLIEDKEDYYVAVGRIVTVKRFDIVVDAFNEIGKKLIIIGDGKDYEKVKKKAKNNIFFTGFLDSDRVREYVGKAKGFIQIGIEGFGIAPIEAQSCGTPVIAYNEGGVRETVINKKTGLFFESQNKESLLNAISEFEKIKFNYSEIHQYSQKFSKERFEIEFKTTIDTIIKNHKF
jgi:glycosyltransferase involved in cell wall biosynthesis